MAATVNPWVVTLWSALATSPASTRSPATWNADAPRRSHASANELASEPCRDAPVDQATAIPAISASLLPYLDRCAAAYREEYGGNEYGGVNSKVLRRDLM